MSRILYRSPNLSELEATYQDLKEHGVADYDLHVIGRKQGKILRHGLNAANFWYKTDVLNSALKGFFIGLLCGVVLAFLFAWANLLEGVNTNVFSFLILLLATGFGTWIGGFLGIQSRNHKLSKYYHFVDEGNYLLLIDTNDQEIENIHTTMSNQHPQLELLSDDVETAIPFKFMQTSH